MKFKGNPDALRFFLMGLVTVHLFTGLYAIVFERLYDRLSLIPLYSWQSSALFSVIFAIGFLIAGRRKQGLTLKKFFFMQKQAWKARDYKSIAASCLIVLIIPVPIIWPAAEYLCALFSCFLEVTPLLNLIPEFVPIDIQYWIWGGDKVYALLVYAAVYSLAARYICKEAPRLREQIKKAAV